MQKIILALAVLAGIATTQVNLASAETCRTTCNMVGNTQYCNTYCTNW